MDMNAYALQLLVEYGIILLAHGLSGAEAFDVQSPSFQQLTDIGDEPTVKLSDAMVDGISKILDSGFSDLALLAKVVFTLRRALSGVKRIARPTSQSGARTRTVSLSGI